MIPSLKKKTCNSRETTTHQKLPEEVFLSPPILTLM